MVGLWQKLSTAQNAFKRRMKRNMLRQVLTSKVNIIAIKVYQGGEVVQLLENGQMIAFSSDGAIMSDSFYTDNKDSISLCTGCFANTKKGLAVFTSDNEILVASVNGLFTNATTVVKTKVSKLSDAKKVTIRCMAFSPTDAELATGGADFVLRIYDAESGLLLTHSIDTHTQFIVGITYSPCGEYIATGCKDKFLRVFKVNNLGLEGDKKLELDMVYDHDMGGRCYAVAFSPSGRKLAAGSDNKKSLLLDMNTFTIRREMFLHKDHVRIVSFLKENRLVTGGKDGDLYIIDVISGQAILPIRNVGWSAMVSHFGNEFVTCSQESSSGPVLNMNVFNIFQDLTSEFVSTSKLTSACSCICFNPLGETVYIGCKNGDVAARNVSSFKNGPSYRLHNNDVSAIVCSPTSGLVASASGTTIYISNLQQGSAEDVMQTSKEIKVKSNVTALAFSKCGVLLAVGDVTGHVMLFNADNDFTRISNAELCPCSILSMDFSQCTHMEDSEGYEGCNALLAVGAHNKLSYVINAVDAINEYMETGLVDESINFIVPGHEKEVFSVAFSADGEILATGSRDKTVRTISLETRQTITKLEGHSDHITGVCFTPKRQVISVSLDRTCRVYSTEREDNKISRERFIQLPAAGLCVAAAKICSRNAQLVAAGCNDGSVVLIDLSFSDQQPLFREAKVLIERAQLSGDLSPISRLVNLFPFVVLAEDRHGNTLLHYAVGLEDDQLLAILLQSKLPMFWLPMSKNGMDILQLAAASKSRASVKLILDCIVAAKEHNQLCPLSSRDNRFLRTLMVLSEDMHELLAQFLKQFGLDDAPAEVTGEQMLLRSPETVIVCTDTRVPEGLWPVLQADGELNEPMVGQYVKMEAKYISIAHFAGILQEENENPMDKLKDTILHRFVQANDARLFGNPLMKIVLDYKWQTYARDIFYHEIFLFCVFLILYTLLTFFAVSLPKSSSPLSQVFSSWKAALSVFLACLVPWYCVRQLFMEFRQIDRSRAVRRATGIDDNLEEKRTMFEKTLVTSMHDEDTAGHALGRRASKAPFKRQSTVGTLSRRSTLDDGGVRGRNRSRLGSMDFFGNLDESKRHYVDEASLYFETFYSVALDGWNVLQSLTAISSFFGCVLFLFGFSSHVIPMALGAFLFWLEILYFLRAFEFTGGLVRMVFKVFYYTGPFMSLLLVVLFGSANCLFVLFSSVESEETLFSIQDSFVTAVFKAFKLLVLGDGSIEDGIDGEGTLFTNFVKILFVFLMVGVNIFMLNLLINLMDDFMQKINDEEGDAFPFEKARIIAEIELVMGKELFMRADTFPKWLHLLVLKGGELSEKSTGDEWVGTVQAIRSESAMLERRTREALIRMERVTATQIESLTKKHNDRISQLESNVSNRLEGLGETLSKFHAHQQGVGDMVQALCKDSDIAIGTVWSRQSSSTSSSRRHHFSPQVSRRSFKSSNSFQRQRAVRIHKKDSIVSSSNTGDHPLSRTQSDQNCLYVGKSDTSMFDLPPSQLSAKKKESVEDGVGEGIGAGDYNDTDIDTDIDIDIDVDIDVDNVHQHVFQPGKRRSSQPESTKLSGPISTNAVGVKKRPVLERTKKVLDSKNDEVGGRRNSHPSITITSIAEGAFSENNSPKLKPRKGFGSSSSVSSPTFRGKRKLPMNPENRSSSSVLASPVHVNSPSSSSSNAFFPATMVKGRKKIPSIPNSPPAMNSTKQSHLKTKAEEEANMAQVRLGQFRRASTHSIRRDSDGSNPSNSRKGSVHSIDPIYGSELRSVVDAINEEENGTKEMFV
eukprot:m.65999 g.65999  ORF g.65999 m.65999 type:complete len:1782 (+) comp8174_c0_seq1:61-5406(+)